jgi:hypothetical protein
MEGIISGPLGRFFGFGQNASTSPVVPGMAMGNMSGLQPTKADMSWYNRTMRDAGVDKIRQTLPESERGRFDTIVAQSDNPLEAAKGYQPSMTSYAPPVEGAVAPSAPETITPASTELSDIEKEYAGLGTIVDKSNLAADKRLGRILDYQTEAAERAQKFGKEAAKEAFKYEMLGRIPDTIGAALSGQGQLMREGSRDIANIMMGSVASMPEPRAAAISYQRPSFKYFK